MKEIKLTPLKELTAEIIKKDLIVHATRSSLRRVAGTRSSIFVPASEKCPDMTYILSADGKAWVPNVLSVDVNKYLLLKSLG